MTLTERRMPIPVKITPAIGYNCTAINIISGRVNRKLSKHTRPIPPPMAAENVLRTFTVGLSHLVNFSFVPRD
jgi:hypothetical protein